MLYIARGFFSDEQTAQDAVSEAIIRIIENIDRFEEIPSPLAKGLVIIITKNICRDKMKKAELPVTELGDEADTTPSPEALVISEETVNGIMACMVKLPEQYADILRLKVVYHLDDSRIAKLLAIRPQNARTRLSRARAALIRIIKKEGLL
jgi:RNA polymerase sigma-70 factor (ECF subfamily)